MAGYRRCERTSDSTSKLRAIALPDDEYVAWVPDERECFRPFSTGGIYVNAQLSEDDSDSTAAHSSTTGVSPRSNARRTRTICLFALRTLQGVSRAQPLENSAPPREESKPYGARITSTQW